MKKLAAMLLCFSAVIALAAVPVSAQTVASFTKDADGVLCVLYDGSRLKLQVCSDNVIRVVHTTREAIPSPQGYVVGRDAFTPGTWDATDNGDAIVLTTPKMMVTVDKTTELVSFATPGGTVIGRETQRTLTAVTKGGEAGFSGTLQFSSLDGEAVYGLGNLSMATPGWGSDGTAYWESMPPDREGTLDIRNFTVDLHQSNWYDVIPFFMTTSGYGVLLNFCCHAVKTPPLNFAADFLTNDAWDYFFIYGPQFDTVVAGYRGVTGPAPMLPKWAFGFWQCKNRYMSADALKTAVSTFRSNGIPLDCIVQDWSWWSGTTEGYGSFTWDTPYANASQWIEEIHQNNCHFALSIWPTFSAGTPHLAEMQSHFITVPCNGDAATPGSFMNIFDSQAADLIWSYMNTTCLSAGVDAWWMDATEPECQVLTGQITPGTGLGSGVIDRYANAYALAHAKNIYEKQRTVSSDKRVVNLTRSFYGGQHRFGTIYWGGDISSGDIKNVATSVSGGINSCMAGNPYWCSDIGGFMDNGNLQLNDDILARWFEAGTFFPLFRIHGSRDTEIYGMSATVKPIAIAFSKLRYRLMPYIYSLAWKVTSEGYTMTRALPFDFPDDPAVRNIADQFMFGPALLVNPVSEAAAISRSLYLPAGTWYDFWTGTPEEVTAGKSKNVMAPLEMIPVYARAGSIIPMGPRMQYATEKNDPIELRIYPGADAQFTLYEDENDGYGYETGSYSTIPISYTEADGKVTIGPRSGTFPGMPEMHTFNVVFVKTGHGIADTVTGDPDCVIEYNGSPMRGCPAEPVAVNPASIGKLPAKPLQTYILKTSGERLSFPPVPAGYTRQVAVYNLSGRLLARATTAQRRVSPREDFGLSEGIYLVKVRAVRQ
ncbi:MAG: glycoside hydrolase family 31 protein [Chitinispirillaceae bacterium]|nr:glycoside hydrolase family 31 protein [Chitinispirillaceae bacterium]